MTLLYPFQREGVHFIEDHEGRALIGDEMGLGKTLQALTWLKWNRHARPVVVVCPASIKFNWQAEALHHIGMRAEILSGRKRIRARAQSLTQHPMLIVNYDILVAWVKYLKRLKPQVVIADECQAVKNHTTAWSKAFRYLCEDVPHVIALSGTPIENNAAEFWNILNILRPNDKRFRSRYAWCFRFSHARRTPWGWTFKGCKHPEKLHKVVQEVMCRHLKKDVIKDLPQQTKSIVLVGMEHPYEYKQAVHNFRHWLAATEPARARKYQHKHWKAEQYVKLGYLKRLVARLKMKAAHEWIDNFLANGDDKLLVFGIHKSILGGLHDKYGGVKVVGGTPNKQRKINFDQFNNDPACRLMFGNLKAAGVGWNCKHWTTLTVELDWKPATHEQADNRTHGIGRGGGMPSINYYMICHGSIEVKLTEYLHEKQQMLDGVLDGKFSKNGDEQDIFDLLCDALR